MVEKPDVYVCQKCQERFQKAVFVNIEEDGIVFTKPSCPKCGSIELSLSSLSVVESE